MRIAIVSLALLTLAPTAASQQSLGGLHPGGLHDLFGQVITAARQPATGAEPFRVTSEGGKLITDLNAGPAHAFQYYDPTVGGPTPLVGRIQGSDLYFFAYLANGKIGLGRTDGSSGGTSILNDFPKSGEGIHEFGYGLNGVGLAERFVFAAQQTTLKEGLWSSDGTSTGLQLLGETKGLGLGFTRLGNVAVFFDGEGSRKRLWRTDGSPAGTSVYHTFPEGTYLDSKSIQLVGDEVYFALDDGSVGMELWRTDGTSAGTSLVRDVNPGLQSSAPRDFVEAGGALYFTANDGSGLAVWRSDGTAAGTASIAQIVPGSTEGPRHLTALGDRLFFAHRVSGSQDRLYTYDHTPPRLELLHTFTSGTGSFEEGIREVKAVGSRRIFFQGKKSLTGAELWASDGTSAGTQLFDNIQFGSGGGEPKELLLSNGRLFFVAKATPGGEAVHNRAIGATAQSFGVGCSASGLLPKLSADDPVLGGTAAIRVEGASAFAFVSVFAGPKVAPTGLGFGCFTHFDLSAVSFVASGMTNAAGDWMSPSFQLPSDLSLAGEQLTIQAIVGPTGTQPLGFDLSSPVLLTFGS